MATTGASPPPYEAYGPDRRGYLFVAQSESREQPGPAMSGKWYREDAQGETIKFVFYPDPSGEWTTQEWAALLRIKCPDVPRLMREGFYWDSSNVIREDGYINNNPNLRTCPFPLRGQGWDCSRHYFLKDLQQPQRWIATIDVYALHRETAFRFDLSQLSRERIQIVSALSQLGNDIYLFSYGEPHHCFNAIYDNMPMEGQWPWPRRDTTDGPTKEKAQCLKRKDGKESSEGGLS
ncbi:hypothetical protein F5Y01DRAFT_328369 [Xylaria sp. FL0043]|nr:hypothetical protein F5Y01DRAFT_328369 [Xylaria sp. FL0043]